MNSKLRRDARACVEAAIAAVEPKRLVRNFLQDHSELLGDAERIRVIGIGKAAGAMTTGALEHAGARIAGGVVIVPPGLKSETPREFEGFEGGHPIPNAEGVAGAEAVETVARDATGSDLLLCLISGGGSALMTLPPPGVSLADLQRTTDLMLRGGADIHDLNAVRKHLDRLKGGRLARLAAPARLVALVLSDVVGDPLDVIASGPVTPDPTTFAEALGVVERLGIAGRLPASVREHLESGRRGELSESPKTGDPCFETVDARLVGSNRTAVEAALREASGLGYETRLLSTELIGEAREIGAQLAARARRIRSGKEAPRPPACLVAAGETTVTVTGGGRGGRNQELVLGAARELDGLRGCLVLSVGTDGIDGPTDAAGALADGDTIARAQALGLDPEAILAENDSYRFFRALDDLVVTGPTGTNVMDIQLVLIS